jgi:hypothetical protein
LQAQATLSKWHQFKNAFGAGNTLAVRFLFASGLGFQGSGFMFVNNICKEVHLNLSQICLFHLFSSGPGPWGLFFLNIFWLDTPFNDGTP